MINHKLIQGTIQLITITNFNRLTSWMCIIIMMRQQSVCRWILSGCALQPAPAEGRSWCNEQDYGARLAGTARLSEEIRPARDACFIHGLHAQEWLSSLSCCQSLSLSISVFLPHRGPPTAAAGVSGRPHAPLCAFGAGARTCCLCAR